MPAAEHAVTIGRSVGEVFAFVADGENAAKWRSGVVDAEHVSGTGVGAVYRQGVKGPGGRRVAADSITAASCPKERPRVQIRGCRSSAVGSANTTSC